MNEFPVINNAFLHKIYKNRVLFATKSHKTLRIYSDTVKYLVSSNILCKFAQKLR